MSTHLGLSDLADAVWEMAEDAGWHKRQTGFLDRVGLNLALIHSEVSEALEAFRKHGIKSWFAEPDDKPEGLGSELADVMIRTLELCRMLGIDADTAVRQKMAYNAVRADVPARSDTLKKF